MLSSASSLPDAHAEWILRIQNKFGFGIHKCRTFDAGINLPFALSNATFEYCPDDALLFPHLTLADFSFRIEAGELGAGSSAAGRTIVGLSGTQYEILAIDGRQMGWAEQLDVVDF